MNVTPLRRPGSVLTRRVTPLLRQQLVDLAVELRNHTDVRDYLAHELADDNYVGERLTLAVLYAALDRPDTEQLTVDALDRIGGMAQAGGDRSLHEHDRRCAFALGHPDCGECEQHWQQELDDALAHLLEDVLSVRAVADLLAVAA